MRRDQALAILHEHAGTQWDARIVEAVTTITQLAPAGIIDRVGHTRDAESVGCRCVDALPEPVQASSPDPNLRVGNITGRRET